jgi:hypothetical protein
MPPWRRAESPTAHAESRGEAELRSGIDDRTPTAAVDAQGRVNEATAVREEARNPEAAARTRLDDEVDAKVDEKTAGAQANVGVKVTTKKPDGSE